MASKNLPRSSLLLKDGESEGLKKPGMSVDDNFNKIMHSKHLAPWNILELSKKIK